MLDFVLGTNAASLEVNQSIVSGQTIWEKEISEKGYVNISNKKGHVRGKRVMLSGSIQHSKTARILDEALKSETTKKDDSF